MYASPKLNNLAHVAMSIIITVASTTASFSHTNITNATLATAVTTSAPASTDARTTLTAVGKTAVDFLSETSTVKLTNNKKTRTVFSISTNSTRGASIHTNATPAVATAAFKTTSPKNTTITIFTTATTSHPNSTKNKTLSSVQENISQKTAKLLLPYIETSINRRNTINLTSTNATHLSTIINGTNTVRHTVTHSPLLDTITSKINASESSVYLNITYGRKFADTGSAPTLRAGSSFTRVGTDAPEKQHLQEEISTASGSLDKVKKTTKNDKNKFGYQWPSSSSSFWRQTVRLRRRRFADFKITLRRPMDIRGNKYSIDNLDGYSTNKAVISRKLLTQWPTLTYQESLIHSKITPTKPGKLLFDLPSEPLNFETDSFHLKVLPSFDKASSELNVEKTKQLKFLPENREKNNAENALKKDYKIRTNDRQIDSDISQVSPDSIDKQPGSKESSVHRKSLISAIISTHPDLLPIGGCRHCLRIKAQKKPWVFLKNMNRRKRKHRSMNTVAMKSKKMDVGYTVSNHQENIYNEQGSKIKPLLSEIVKKSDNYVNHRNIEVSNANENKVASDSRSQKSSHFLDREKQETDSGYIKFFSSNLENDKTNSLFSGEDKSLNNKDQTKSRMYIKVNFTNNTNMDIPIASQYNVDNLNDVTNSSNIRKTFKTEAGYNKDPNCKDKTLCPVPRFELPVTLKPIIRKPLTLLTRTSINFLGESNKENDSRISIEDKLQKVPNNSGFTFGKDNLLETGERNTKGGIHVLHKMAKTILQNNLTVSVNDKHSSVDLLKNFVNESEMKPPFGEKNTQTSNGRNEQSLLRKHSTVKVKDDFLVGNRKQHLSKHSDDKLQLMKQSGSFPKEIRMDGVQLTKNIYTPENIDNSNTINNNIEDLKLQSGTSGRHQILHEDYTHNHFKDKVNVESEHQKWNSMEQSSSRIAQRRDFETASDSKTYSQKEDLSGTENGYHNSNGPQRGTLVEKHVDVLTGYDENVENVTDGKDEHDNEKSNEEIGKDSYSDDVDEEDDILDTYVKLGPIHDPGDFIQQENTREDREYSWLKNAYDSILYRQSHDLFMDPEFEKKRLEGKIFRRWNGRLLSDGRQGLDASTHAEYIYLPLQNILDRYRHPLITSNYDGHKGHRHLSRTKRATDNIFTDSPSTQKIKDFHDKFAERVSDDDEAKPCGNHGRHRRHVGGMVHLTRHQRRDIHREPRTRHRYPRDTRFPSAPKSFSGDDFGKTAYFSGIRELLQLRLRKRSGLAQDMIPRQQFTIELWIKPEGGLSNPTVILGLFDMCHQDHKSKGWHIGIRTYEEGQEEDARIYFSLETDRANSPSVLMSDRTYEPNRWVHVAASYSGKKMKLYINTALVGVQHFHSGDIFSVSASSCKEIFLGGMPYSKEDLYRGSVDQILLWDFPLKHGDVVQNMFDSSINMDREKGIAFKESFDDLDQWKSFLKDEPVLHFSNIEDYRYDIQLVAPPCGKTVCDDPDVIRSYVQHSELRQEKRVRYRIVNVMDDDEDNPKVSKIQTVAQHRALVATFKQYNISWELEEVKLRNTSLRHKTVLLDCLPMQIGNKHCNRECQHTQTGNDGGDCDPDEIPCDSINLGNGRCDFECNRAYYEWDKGDCCQSAFKSANSTCLDPDSPHRKRATTVTHTIYLSMDEYKTALNVNGSTHLNVYLASWSLKGLATFPWEKHVYDVLGGTVVDTNSFGQPGKMDGLIHEFGHNLGLWHVHHGVSEVKCDDPCMESEPSLELGDLCSDTAPTSQNTHCRDPDWSVHACGISSFKNTPYRNYMSYASGNCTNHFTPQQVARMHCYLDLVYQPWQTIMRPSPVPLPPKVVMRKSVLHDHLSTSFVSCFIADSHA